MNTNSLQQYRKGLNNMHWIAYTGFFVAGLITGALIVANIYISRDEVKYNIIPTKAQWIDADE